MKNLSKKMLAISLSICLLFSFSIVAFTKSTNQESDTKKLEKLIKEIANGSDNVIGNGVPQHEASTGVQTEPDKITAQWESGGPSHTHQFLASRGILILKNDKGNVVDQLYENNGAAIILEYSDMPDVDEIDMYTYRGHYYDPATGKNYLGLTYPTANRKFEEHYNNAKANFKTDKTLAWQELGRAIHYLADLNTPHHAANQTPLTSNHIQYETWVDVNRMSFITNNAGINYDYALNTTAWVIGHNASVNAKSYINYAMKSDDVNMRYATSKTLTLAQKLIAAVYYKFLKEVGEI